MKRCAVCLNWTRGRLACIAGVPGDDVMLRMAALVCADCAESAYDYAHSFGPVTSETFQWRRREWVNRAIAIQQEAVR